MLSYRKIIEKFEEFATNHFVIKSYGTGEAFQIVEHNKLKNRKYPMMWVEDLPFPFSTKSVTYSFRVYFLAQVATLKNASPTTLEQTNVVEVKSDMLQVAQDLVSFWVQDHNFDEIDLEKNTLATPFHDTLEDSLTGFYIDIKLEQAFTYNSCIIPMSGATPPPTEGVIITINGDSFTTTACGSSEDIIVKDTLGAAVGSKIGSEWIVPTAGIKTVTFNQPHPAQDIVYDLYDAAWREANGEIPTLTANQFTQQLGATPWEIKYDDSDVTGITEHLFRLVGINGGYVIVDTDDTTKLYFDKDGVASNENDVFGKDGDHLMIDRLTGLACAYNNQKESGGGNTPSDFYDEMWNTDNFAGYTGEWFAMSIEEATTTLFQGTYRESLIQIWRDTDWFLFPGTLLLGSAYISTPTINIAAIGLIIYNFQAWARSNTTATGRFYVPFRRFDEWPLY